MVGLVDTVLLKQKQQKWLGHGTVTFPIHVVRHSRLPAGNALWFCQNLFFFSFFFLFLFYFIFSSSRRQGFRMITFDRQAGPLQNFNRSHVMVIGRSVSFSDPVRPPGGGVGRPKHPKIPPSEIFFLFCMRFKTPGTFLKKKNLVGKKNLDIFRPPPPPPNFFLFLRKTKFSY